MTPWIVDFIPSLYRVAAQPQEFFFALPFALNLLKVVCPYPSPSADHCKVGLSSACAEVTMLMPVRSAARTRLNNTIL